MGFVASVYAGPLQPTAWDAVSRIALFVPTKDETADYLEAYARAFELPVRTGVKVDRVSKAGDRFQVICGEHTLLAENVVVATGASSNPRVPPFARELDERIVQLHSKEVPQPITNPGW